MSTTPSDTTVTLSPSEQEIVDEFSYALDSMWILIAGFLVFFMQAGFAVLEVGSVRSKNAQNILLKNLFDIAVGSIVWYLLGYGFAYGEDSGGFIGTTQFAATGDDFSARDWFFQWAFAATAATIVSGALAERTNFAAYALYSTVITAFIYPVVVHWTWGGGWLGARGYVDFAGSGIVHMVGGVSGLIGAAFVGPRARRFLPNENGCCRYNIDRKRTDSFRPHNMPFVILGTLILWFGWYGFNCGSTLGFVGSNVDAAAVVAMNTSIAAGVAGTVALLLRLCVERCGKDNRTHYDVPATANGILAGLVAITAGCADVTAYGAFIIGAIGGGVYILASYGVRKSGVDDPLDAFAIHGATGAWGVFAVGLFHTTDGAFYGGGGTLLGWQVAGIVVITVWSAAFAALIFGLLKACSTLRVSDEEEATGLDAHHHGGAAYAFKRKSSTLPEQGEDAALMAEEARGVQLTTLNKNDEENETAETQERPADETAADEATATAPSVDGGSPATAEAV